MDKEPKYLKEIETGYCHFFNARLWERHESKKRLEPYNGEVDADGFAVEAKAKSSSKAAEKPAAKAAEKAVEPAAPSVPKAPALPTQG